ncbi:MAG: GNAT family N-acetyltransferase [Tepidisphaerales bacterium]
METIGPGDFSETGELLDAAFAPSRYESALMTRLRSAGRPIHEWVLRDEGRIVAYIAFSTAYRGSSPAGFHLAPLAVLPGCQRRGFGASLARQALAHPDLAQHAVFVLGDQNYYRRFGFLRILNPHCPFDPRNEHFQALRWAPADDFEIGYEPEFHTT